MDWIAATIISSVFLGLYDLGTKHAVRDNAVLPVLFFANVCSAGIWLILMSAATVRPEGFPALFTVAPLTGREHLLLLLKSFIVACSWVCTYFAVKHLPVSLASPIRATGPVWTFLGALLVLGERPAWLQILGVVITLGSFVGLSFAGAREGIHFRRNKWIAWQVAGTLLGAMSGLYDKVLLGRLGFSAATVQAWFCIYLALLFLPLAIGWKLRLWQRQTFEWRWSIIGISLALLLADFVYFDALRNPDALVSLVASLRRGSILVAFFGSLWLFKEKNGAYKLPAVLGVLVGIVLTILG